MFLRLRPAGSSRTVFLQANAQNFPFSPRDRNVKGRFCSSSSGGAMLSAIVLLTTERDKTNKVAETLADTEGVSEVYSVAGRYDLAAIVRATDNDQLAKVVTERIRAVPGIVSSETLIAFRVYSRHDLERMFSIGMEHP